MTSVDESNAGRVARLAEWRQREAERAEQIERKEKECRIVFLAPPVNEDTAYRWRD